MVTNLRQLVDKELELEFDLTPNPSPTEREQGNKKRHTLYSRLYENMVMCDSVSDFINQV
jgi:hypothetical protein